MKITSILNLLSLTTPHFSHPTFQALFPNVSKSQLSIIDFTIDDDTPVAFTNDMYIVNLISLLPHSIVMKITPDNLNNINTLNPLKYIQTMLPVTYMSGYQIKLLIINLHTPTHLQIVHQIDFVSQSTLP